MGKGINIKYAGADLGYDSCKIITNLMERSNQKPLIFPSLAKDREDGLIQESDAGMGERFSKEKMAIDFRDNNDDWHSFIIGDYVINQLEQGGSNYEVDKYKNPEEIAKLLAGLSAIYPEAREITIDTLVTGLPIQHQEKHKEPKSRSFTGEFEGRITNSKGKRTTVEYKIKDVTVIPESLGALMYYYTMDEVKKKLNSTVGFLDCGGRTTDGIGYNQGNLIKSSPFTLNYGMSNVIKSVANEITVDKKKVRKAIIKESNTVFKKQDDIPINHLVEKYSDKVAKDISTGTGNEWRDIIDDLRRILVIGGGGQQLAPYLNKHFGNIQVESLPDSQISNVLGYLRRAKALHKKKNEESNPDNVVSME